ncbi:hypothetical protein ACH79_02025 [Bradyrhizobium sp. CCBAU 051011]|nr:hypothetical protein ACH79_02025 [Bradyrhizobium sp. CCBAU 051011]
MAGNDRDIGTPGAIVITAAIGADANQRDELRSQSVAASQFLAEGQRLNAVQLAVGQKRVHSVSRP